MGGFFNFSIQMKRFFLTDKSIDRRAQGRGSSIAGNQRIPSAETKIQAATNSASSMKQKLIPLMKTVNENLLLSSSPSVPSIICERMYQKNLSGRQPLFTFGVSRKSWVLINFNATYTSKLDLQLIQVLKEAFCHYLESQQTNVNDSRRIFTECKGYANEPCHER